MVLWEWCSHLFPLLSLLSLACQVSDVTPNSLPLKVFQEAVATCSFGAFNLSSHEKLKFCSQFQVQREAHTIISSHAEGTFKNSQENFGCYRHYNRSQCTKEVLHYYVPGSVHHKSILINVQQDVTICSLYFILLRNHSTCFGCRPHPSSGVHKTVTTATSTSHILCAATSLQRGQVGHVGVRWLHRECDLYWWL